MRLFVHATAYSELRRPSTSSHSRVASALVRALITDASYWFRDALKPSPTETAFRSYINFQGPRCPLRPARCSVYASPILFTGREKKNPDSAIDATLDTGGWLDLTRQGLSPCKAHQASLGALTPMLSGVGPAPHRKQPDAVPALGLKTRHMIKERRRANVRCSMLLGRNLYFIIRYPFLLVSYFTMERSFASIHPHIWASK